MKKLFFRPYMMIRFTQSLIFIWIVVFSMEALAQQTENWEISKKITETIAEPLFPDREYLITDYETDSNDALPAIQEAIKVANYEGGGKVIIPEGTWFLNGPIHLKSNINLHVAEGAELVFSDDPQDYLPQVLTRWEGTEAYNYSSLIYAYQVHNVAITGKGIIDGNAQKTFAQWRDLQDKAQNEIREMGAKGVPVHQRVFGNGDYLRPSFVQFFSSSQILVEGVTLQNSPMWVNHFIYSSNITVRGVTVKSYRLNNDGVVLDSSTLALIENCSFSTGDDSIVIKSGRDQDGRKIAKPSEKIVIRNNFMEGHNALAVGSEISGGVRDVYMENNELGKVSSAIYFKSNLDRGGYIEQVRVSNIKVDSADVLLRFNTNYHSYRGGEFPSLYRDFVIENVEAIFANLVFEIKGIEQMPIQNVFLNAFNVTEANNISDILHVNNLTAQNIHVNGMIINIE